MPKMMGPRRPAPPLKQLGPRRGGRGKPTRQALEILGNKMEGVMRADLKGAFSTFAELVNYGTVADAVYSGDWRKVFATIPLDGFAPIMEEGMAGAGRAMAQASEIEGDKFATFTLPDGGRPRPASLSVGVDNPKVVEYVTTRTGELIQNVTEDLQTNVQRAVATGIADRLSPRQVAGLIRDGLPLNVQQQTSLEKYKAGLAQTNLSAARQSELGERMRNALADGRALTIARTESQYAITAGSQATWAEAMDQGLIGRSSLRVWQTEAEPCDLCRSLQGKKAKMGKPFIAADGTEVLSVPAHPNCRCVESIEPVVD